MSKKDWEFGGKADIINSSINSPFVYEILADDNTSKSIVITNGIISR